MKGKILVVEDNELVRELLQAALSLRGHEVLAAGSIHEAEDILARQAVDLVVTDLGLPDGSGWQLVERTRVQRPASELPILVLSGCLPDERRLSEAGASGYLMKPVSNAELAAKCSLHLERSLAAA